MQALEEAGVPVDQEYIVQLPEIDSDLATSAALQLLNLSEPRDAFSPYPMFTVRRSAPVTSSAGCRTGGRGGL